MANVGQTLQAKMAGTNPIETLAALRASLPPRVNSSLSENLKTIYIEKTGPEFQFLGWTMAPDLSAQDLSTSITLVRQSLSPMEPTETLTELTKVFVRTTARAQDHDDLKLRLVVYAEDLSEYPADVARYALREWPKLSTWWPTTHDLVKLMERWTERRRMLLSTLEDALRIAPTA